MQDLAQRHLKRMRELKSFGVTITKLESGQNEIWSRNEEEEETIREEMQRKRYEEDLRRVRQKREHTIYRNKHEHLNCNSENKGLYNYNSLREHGSRRYLYDTPDYEEKHQNLHEDSEFQRSGTSSSENFAKDKEIIGKDLLNSQRSSLSNMTEAEKLNKREENNSFVPQADVFS